MAKTLPAGTSKPPHCQPVMWCRACRLCLGPVANRGHDIATWRQAQLVSRLQEKVHIQLCFVCDVPGLHWGPGYARTFPKLCPDVSAPRQEPFAPGRHPPSLYACARVRVGVSVSVSVGVDVSLRVSMSAPGYALRPRCYICLGYVSSNIIVHSYTFSK